MKEINAYRCEHCRKVYLSRHGCAKHETGCYKNPNRKPRLGELTFCRMAGRLLDYDISADADSYPPGMAWLEWTWHSEAPPPWWPTGDWVDGCGHIYTESGWIAVNGHRLDYPEGAHGCAGGPSPFDAWPEVHVGMGQMVSLERLPARCRLEHLRSIAAT